MIQPGKALGYWISWAPDDSLLRGCHKQPSERMKTPRGTFRKVSTVFSGYRRVRTRLLARKCRLQHDVQAGSCRSSYPQRIRRQLQQAQTRARPAAEAGRHM